MKIEYKDIQVSINSEDMHEGQKWQVEQAIRTCIDLYKEGRLQCMDCGVAQGNTEGQ